MLDWALEAVGDTNMVVHARMDQTLYNRSTFMVKLIGVDVLSRRDRMPAVQEKILVADDEESIVELIRLYLKKDGFALITAWEAVLQDRTIPYISKIPWISSPLIAERKISPGWITRLISSFFFCCSSKIFSSMVPRVWSWNTWTTFFCRCGAPHRWPAHPRRGSTGRYARRKV